MCFFNLAEYAYLEQNEAISTLKVLNCRRYSVQKVTKFTQENNVLNVAPSNPDGFLLRDTRVLSTYLIGLLATTPP
jgi:hypothetical protein